ncbi:signal transducer [Pseudozyma hubeiensis SY62]|uniref:Signal transducer n=1 Tax=Pseudozyma hubeiensis (strain SY62) TaxID=1305764 RepID=R9P4M9_PSEHS|nr:signal transducer [Pseudozyma hubeiensis SY62]GAC96301.1 signal transducer [Pseudozyma hubeiensis SY62]
MNASKAHQDIQHVVRDLLSRDPVKFNSTINAYFAGSSTYQGRGLKIEGASQIKHTAYLLNVLDFGSAADIDDRDIRWDAASSTAIVKATRYVRPFFFPLFSFAVPTKVVLNFNAEEGAKKTLYCTQWRDEWPLEQVIRSVPVVRTLYGSLLVPLLTLVFLWASNVAFWLHSKVELVEYRYARQANEAFQRKIQPRLPPSLVKGFDAGVQTAEHVRQHGAHVVSRVTHGPLRLVEDLARTTTVVFNLALPHQLQLPYPSVFSQGSGTGRAESSKLKSQVRQMAKKVSDMATDAVKVASNKTQEATNVDIEGPHSPKSKVSGASTGENKHKDGEQSNKQHSTDEAQTDRPTPDQAGGNGTEERPHATVVVGASEDGTQHPQAKEIDIVTHEVHEHGHAHADSAKQSLYDVLKKDNQLPGGGGGSGGGNGGKKASHKKKSKNGGRK